MKKQLGFSLIELLICVVIIGIIAAIAIPNLLASRRASNEASAISSLRTLHGAQMTYQGTTGAGNYACADPLSSPDATGLTTLQNGNLIDEVLGSGVKSGYSFTCSRSVSGTGTPADFWLGAAPVTHTATNVLTGTGTRYFALFTEGVIHYSNTTQLTPTNTSSAGTPLNN